MRPAAILICVTGIVATPPPPSPSPPPPESAPICTKELITLANKTGACLSAGAEVNPVNVTALIQWMWNHLNSAQCTRLPGKVDPMSLGFCSRYCPPSYINDGAAAPR